MEFVHHLDSSAMHLQCILLDEKCAAFATCIISLGGMNFALLLFPRTAFLDDRGLPMSTMNASHKVRPLSLSKWLCYFHYS